MLRAVTVVRAFPALASRPGCIKSCGEPVCDRTAAAGGPASRFLTMIRSPKTGRTELWRRAYRFRKAPPKLPGTPGPMDFRALESLSSMDENIMHYRIELSRTRRGFARVQLPGRELTVEAKGRAGPDWEVLLTDLAGAQPGTVDSGTVEV